MCVPVGEKGKWADLSCAAIHGIFLEVDSGLSAATLVPEKAIVI